MAHPQQQQQQQPLHEPPMLIALLGGQQAPAVAAARAAPGSAWLQLSPDTMHEHRLASQQLCLVGLCSAPAAAPPTPGTPAAARASPGALAAGSPSSFGPAAAPALSPEDAELVDLLARTGGGADGAVGGGGGEPALLHQRQPGRFLVPVTLWPCARLARGAALLSPAAVASLALPEPGSHLALFALPPATAGPPPPADTLQLRLCTAGGLADGSLLTPQHVGGGAPAASPAPGGDGGGGGGFSTPVRQPGRGGAAAGPPRTPQGPSPKGGSSASKKQLGGGSSRKGVSRPREQAGGGSGPDGAAAAGDAACLWQLQLLRGGVDWSNETHRHLLQRLAHRQLLGRCVLPGSLAYLPVLGLQLLFQLQPSAPQQPGQQPPHPLQPLLVTGSCGVRLLVPGDEGTGPAGAAGSVGGGGGAGGGGGPAAGRSRDVSALVEAARRAAREAVDSSGQDAAMQAAERATRAGAAALAAGGGYGRLGGISGYGAALNELVLLPLKLPQLYAKYKLRPPRGVLLHGPPGSGKTALARAAAQEAGASLLVLNGPDVLTEYYGESEAGLAGVFAAAAALAPAVVFIDELDALAPSRESGGHGGASAHTAAAGGGSGGGAAGEASARVLAQLLSLMDGLGAGGGGGGGDGGDGGHGEGQRQRVVVIGATNRPNALDPALRRPGRFERELEVGVPDPAAREDILRVRLASVQHCLSDEQLRQLAATTHGFVGADLAALVNEAALAALRRHVRGAGAQPGGPREGGEQANPAQGQGEGGQGGRLCVCWRDVCDARLLVKPSALREVAVEVPQVSWDDVGGLEDVKQRLKEVVLWPQRHAADLARLGVSAPRGVLLFGPPGCSKTLLARAVAAGAGLNFLSVKGAELYSQYVGESERAVAALFARARQAAPAVVFFDELDGLVGSRGAAGGGGGGGGSGGAGERVLAQLLTELDGLQPRLGVVVLAATNRPDRVDAALLRPGRFDRLLLVPPPDAGGRREVLRVHTRRTPLAADADLDAVAERTEGYTGADLSALCREAAMAALEEDLGAAAVARRHFDLALLRVPPSGGPDAAALASYQRFQRQSGLVAV